LVTTAKKIIPPSASPILKWVSIISVVIEILDPAIQMVTEERMNIKISQKLDKCAIVILKIYNG